MDQLCVVGGFDVAETIIKVENLSYRYPRTKKWVLKDLNLEIKEGEFIAVMGKTVQVRQPLSMPKQGYSSFSAGES